MGRFWLMANSEYVEDLANRRLKVYESFNPKANVANLLM